MPESQQFITRPPVEIFGRNPGYGFAGLGINTAIGNFTLAAVDLPFGGGLLGLLNWQRTYNSLDAGAAVGAMGPGWTTAFSSRLVVAPQHGLLHQTPEQVSFYGEDGRVLVFTQTTDGAFTPPQDLNASLTRNGDGSYTLACNAGLVSEFDSAGQLTGRSLEGQSATFGYSGSGQLVRVTHSSGAFLGLSYDDSDRISEVATSDGRTVSYAYDPDGCLASVTVPGGGVTAFESTSASGYPQVAHITNADGNVVMANTYDSSTGMVVGQDLPGGFSASFGYNRATGLTTVTAAPSNAVTSYQADSNGRLTKFTNAAGNSATCSYDSDGRPIQTVSAVGMESTVEYDAQGNILSVASGDATTALSYDSSDRVVSMTNPVGATTEYLYSGGSRIPSQITDPNGGVTTIAADSGLITVITDPDGNTRTYGYDSLGNLTSVTSPGGKTTSYQYDSLGNRVRVVLPDGSSASYGYNAAGQVTSVTMPGGAQMAYQYSPGGLLLTTTDPTGAVTSYAYDAVGNQTQVTDPLGRATTFTYNAVGQPASCADPAGEVTRFCYDVVGNLTKVTDPLGTETVYSYDGNGRQTAVQTPSGTTTTGYDARGNVTSVTDAAGGVTSYAFDAANRLISVTTPDGAAWSTSYDAVGNPVTSTDALGAVSKWQWTPGGNLQQVTDPLGRQTAYERDQDGNVVSVTDPGGGVTRYVYDSAGRLISETTPAGLVTSYRYDDAGKIAATIDPRGWATRREYTKRGQHCAVITPGGAVTQYRYDPAGQLTEVINPVGSTTGYGYDNAGRLISVTNPKGAVSRFGYDAAGRLISSADPLGRVTTRAYDSAGSLIAVTDPSGGVQHMSYDADGRLTQRTGTDGTQVSFAYDPAGNRTSMTDATGTTRYAYDGNGRLLTVTGPDGAVLAWAYDAAGQRTALTYPDGLQVGYGYDPNGRLVFLRDPRAGDAVCVLDPDGRLLTEQLPAGHGRRYHYESGLLHRFEAISDDRPAATTTLSYDPDGRIRIVAEEEHDHEYRYDRAGQLVYAARRRAGSPQEELRLSYDAAGNRARLRHDGTETHYRYDDADQLLAMETEGRSTEFRYDSLGRLTEAATGTRRRTITYDGFGQPVVIAGTDDARPGKVTSERIDQTFDGDGLLTGLIHTVDSEPGESERAAAARYRWSAGDQVPQILTEWAEHRLDDMDGHASGPPLDADFSYGYGRTFASTEHAAAVFHHDAFGSAVHSEETGAWVQSRAYDIFGAPEPGEPQDGEHRFRSPELPKFGYRGELTLTESPPLIYLRSRTYDATVGRFTTRDPVLLPGGFTQPVAPYAYAGNDPLNLIDPLGSMFVSLGGTSAPTAASNQIQSAANSADKNAHVKPQDNATALESELQNLAEVRGWSGITARFSGYTTPSLPIVGQWGIQIAHLAVYLNNQQTMQLVANLQWGLSIQGTIVTWLAGGVSLAASVLTADRAANAALAAEAGLGTATAESGAAVATAAALTALDVAIAGAVIFVLEGIAIAAYLEGQAIERVNAQGGNQGVVFRFVVWRWWHTAPVPIISLPWTPFHPSLVKEVSPWQTAKQTVSALIGVWTPTMALPQGTISPQ
ncbi:MAG TPA: RHS repeat-associated core domain-containing protein [Streptosporangiaceae bacterium]|nr:RHS repeat-associated core domain-containing protein [Streptosporangiaceae bacterium]